MIHLKEEGLEIVGHVGDDEEEHGGDADGEDGSQQSSGIRCIICGCLFFYMEHVQSIIL